MMIAEETRTYVHAFVIHMENGSLDKGEKVLNHINKIIDKSEAEAWHL